MSNALVRLDDIKDAVDADDLIHSFLSQNLEVIDDKRSERLRRDWVNEQRLAIKEKYRQRAREAYEKMWHSCGKTKLGHEYGRIDVQGTSIDLCNICSHHFGKEKKTSRTDYNGSYIYDDTPIATAKEMNNSLIEAMTVKLIELDETAGILVWPTPEDMPEKLLKREDSGNKPWYSRNT